MVVAVFVDVVPIDTGYFAAISVNAVVLPFLAYLNVMSSSYDFP